MRSAVLALAAAAAVAASSEDGLIRLNGKDWDTEVHSSDAMWAVLVLAPEHQCGEACSTARTAVERVAPKLEGIINFGVTMFDSEFSKPGEFPQPMHERFNLTQKDEAGNVGVTIPAIVLFMPGARSQPPAEVVLPPSAVVPMSQRGPRVLVDQLKALLPHALVSVNSASLPGFLAAKDPRPRRRVIVVSTKPSAALQARKLSLDLLPVADVGLVMAKHSAVTALLPGVEPGKGGVYISAEGTLPRPGREESDVDPATVRWVKYGGGPKYPEMLSWAQRKAGPPQVPLLSSQEEFQAACAAPGGICAIAVLPSGSADPSDPDAPGPAGALAALAARQFFTIDVHSFSSGTPVAQPLPIRIFRVDAGAQAAWAQAMGASAPGLVALNARSKRFATFMGAFAPDALHGFLMQVLQGSVGLSKAEPWPALAKQIPMSALMGKKKPAGKPKPKAPGPKKVPNPPRPKKASKPEQARTEEL
ncbi:hypothetical protein FNF29_01449 [Cafeteria roenbergensis]|uniref:Thioredoxin domain-containing protein n=1 Tax=Cafeteria roenbergensis TaxID=33653 RepID=A0A5A8CVZ6_CAFRO|nr:hypothetical protein FNF29_01449 [Cafeteria roenbergensis]|eukprot:KAA0156031.1 hypothetical protein FNF29_01449 [Cafeteria roenbergensis]